MAVIILLKLEINSLKLLDTLGMTPASFVLQVLHQILSHSFILLNCVVTSENLRAGITNIGLRVQRDGISFFTCIWRRMGVIFLPHHKLLLELRNLTIISECFLIKHPGLDSTYSNTNHYCCYSFHCLPNKDRARLKIN